MKPLANALKAAMLSSAIAIVGLSVFPITASAGEEGVTCENYGHTCHAIVGGGTLHLLKV